MTFSFIKMFFFLSLAIVFLFILLLCYYLKNKIEVVERRVSSQTDVLGKLIREFKLQACFGGFNSGGNGRGNDAPNGLQVGRLEPVLEQDDESDSDSSSSYEDGADTDEESEDTNSVGMEKVQDDDLLDIDSSVKKNDDDKDEYKDSDFEKLANEEPVAEHFTGEEYDETVQVSQTEEDDDMPALISEPEEEDEEEKTPVELDGTKAEPKEPVFDDDSSSYKDSILQEGEKKEKKTEDYNKMSLVQLKHVAQHTFHLSTTQIAKMKKDDLLKWIISKQITV